MHRAPAGVDWHQLADANWRANFLRRQAEMEQGFVTSNWAEVGSRNLAGRTFYTIFDPSDPEQILVGTANGGLWRGPLDGSSWQPVSDAVGRGSQHLAACTGSSPYLFTGAGGYIHTSSDGGDTWFVPSGLPDALEGVLRVLKDPAGTSRLFLLSGAYQWNGSYYEHVVKLSRSDDAGRTFTTLRTDVFGGKADIWISRTSAGPLYLMLGQKCLRSTNGGVSFLPLGTAPVAATDAYLTGSEGGAPTLYAALKTGGSWELFRSTDAGGSWAWQSDLPDFGGAICASITDADRVFAGGVNGYRSTDGGATFSAMNSWGEYYVDPVNKLHADVQGINCWMKGSQEYFFFNTDGGTYSSVDGGMTVRNISLSGLGVSQYYGTLTSVNDPTLIGAGSQDQGWQNSCPEAGGPPFEFTQIISGDYGHPTSRDHTLNMCYSVYPTFTLLQENENAPVTVRPIFFPPEPDGVSFLPFILADPDDSNVYYFCARHIWKCTRVSGNTYNNVMLPKDFDGGDEEYVSGLAIAPSNHSLWYAATNRGHVYYSGNSGTTWLQSADLGPESHYFYGSAILCSPSDPNLCYLGGNGYSGPAVYRTTNGGADWSPLNAGMPGTMVFGLAFDPAGAIYAATEAGPYRYDSDQSLWSYIGGTDAPNTTYWSVESVPALSLMRFGTHGRGIWDYTISSTSSVARPAEETGGAVAVIPSPARDQARLSFVLRTGGTVRAEIFDVVGRQVAPAVEREVGPGLHQIPLPIGQLRAGNAYIVRLRMPGRVTSAVFRVVR